MSAPAVDRRGHGRGDAAPSAQGALPATVSGISIDSRTHRRRARRSSPFKATTATATIRRRGAGGQGRARRRRRRAARRRCRRMRRCSSCPTCSRRCAISPRAARARTQAQGDRRHRLGRQDRHQGGAAARARRRTARPMPRPPPTTIIGACRCRSRAVRRRALRRVRDRHEPRRRDRAADAAGAPACRDHHHGRAGASRILRLAEPRSPTPRRRSFSASKPAAPR